VIRGVLYLLAAGVAWMGEGFAFSRFLMFVPWQTVAMVVVYAVLFGVACWQFSRLARRHPASDGTLPFWRYVSLAPQLTLVAGSFLSLPILIALLAIGKLF